MINAAAGAVYNIDSALGPTRSDKTNFRFATLAHGVGSSTGLSDPYLG